MKKILQNNVSEIYIALDSDAKIDSIKLAEKIISYGIKAYRLDLKDHDPSSLGFKRFWKLAKSSDEIKFSDIVKDRLYG